jgi:uncharacterized membrane protein
MKNNLFIITTALFLISCGQNNQESKTLNVSQDSSSAYTQNDVMLEMACDPTAYNDFKVVMVKNCNNCHKAGGLDPKAIFSDYNGAVAFKSKIKNRVLEKKDMPMGKKLTAAEMGVVAKWIDGGTPPPCPAPLDQELSEQGLRILDEE